MNREDTIEAIKVMQAFVDGKTVECALRRTVWSELIDPVWNFGNFKYRIKPITKFRPWTADEVPLGAWLRYKEKPSQRCLIGAVYFEADRKVWLEEREHSLDGGKTWLPCGVEEKE